ncbi:non-heme chloroperoxidase [Natronocella acetinitrilica]|uniref:Non-heme chloroperoxidase n=1 Tax=Natronocella acetinitrilica TaxID=414046 RepID=A0AAE3KBW7_9GAMM|nr:alpha/beta hydrolase [Natronocella acetinitrilica]MCP1676190.1 non-heme chloroperoxidase [Natronocella acetinitrilica]
MFHGWFGYAPAGSQHPRLEVISRQPRRDRRSPPLLFVHGAYAGAWCWDEHFLDYFAALGYETHAVSLRGHGRSEGSESLHFHGVTDYVEDVANAVAGLKRTPILIGHSMGGFVVQKYLEKHPALAAVLMATVPPTGLGASVVRMMTGDPMLFTQMSLMHALGPDAVDARSAGRAVFSDNLDEHLLAAYSRRMQAESQRALMEMTFGNTPQPMGMRQLPMLVVGAEDDALFSTADMEATATAFGAELQMVPDMAHAMMLERDWERAAAPIAEWLATRADSVHG